MKATADAILKNIFADQAKLELDLFDGAKPLSDSIPASREMPAEELSRSRFVKPLFHALKVNDVAPSVFSRAPKYFHDLVARMYVDAHRDPDMQDEKSLLVILAKAGVFELYRGEMSEQEAKALDTAMAMRDGPDVVELQRAFAETHPEQLPVSSAFLRGCVRIRDQAGKLSDGQCHAYSDALGMVLTNDATVVGKILGLSEAETRKAGFIADFLQKKADDDPRQCFEADLTFGLIRIMIDRLDPAECETWEWLPGFVTKITTIAEQVQDVIHSEQTFMAIMHAAMAHSFAKAKFDHLSSWREVHRRAEQAEESRQEALLSGRPFKIAHSGIAVTDADEQFHFIQQIPFTSETYADSAWARWGTSVEEDQDEGQVGTAPPAIERDPDADSVADCDPDELSDAEWRATIESTAESPSDFPSVTEAPSSEDLPIGEDPLDRNSDILDGNDDQLEHVAYDASDELAPENAATADLFEGFEQRDGADPTREIHDHAIDYGAEEIRNDDEHSTVTGPPEASQSHVYDYQMKSPNGPRESLSGHADTEDRQIQPAGGRSIVGTHEHKTISNKHGLHRVERMRAEDLEDEDF